MVQTVDAISYIRININFKDAKGTLIKTVEVNEGDDILSIAHEYDIDLEGASHTQLVEKLHSPVVPSRRMRRINCLLDMPCHPFT